MQKKFEPFEIRYNILMLCGPKMQSTKSITFELVI